MDRTKFFQKVFNTDTNVDELDYLWSNFDKFKPVYKPTQYRLNQTDMMRPDLISYRSYGTVNYWWLISYYNGCMNPLSDMVLGDVWDIPSINDIYAFIKKYKIR